MIPLYVLGGIFIGMGIYKALFVPKPKKDNINEIIEMRKKQFQLLQGGKTVDKEKKPTE